MTYLGFSSIAWLAFTAIGTIGLALATVGVIVTSLRSARTDRRRDDRKRLEDRDRYRAEQRDREDHEARQVTVEMDKQPVPATVDTQGRMQAPRQAKNYLLIVTRPSAYPIKLLDAQIVHHQNSGISLTGTGSSFGPPEIEHGWAMYKLLPDISELMNDPSPIVRFTDPHGILYYTYKQQTKRYPLDTDWAPAAADLDRWIRTGPGVAHQELAGS